MEVILQTVHMSVQLCNTWTIKVNLTVFTMHYILDDFSSPHHKVQMQCTAMYCVHDYSEAAEG